MAVTLQGFQRFHRKIFAAIAVLFFPLDMPGIAIERAASDQALNVRVTNFGSAHKLCITCITCIIIVQLLKPTTKINRRPQNMIEPATRFAVQTEQIEAKLCRVFVSVLTIVCWPSD